MNKRVNEDNEIYNQIITNYVVRYGTMQQQQQQQRRQKKVIIKLFY
jgi:hypothetical protein